MDGERFDWIVRGMASGLGRRRLLSTLSGGMAAVLGLTAVSEGEARRKRKVRIEGPCGNGSGKKNRCKSDKQCCTGVCKKRRCRCRKLNQSCSEDRNCCPDKTGRTCIEGTCQLADVCGPDTCALGCCDAGGNCLMPIDQGNAACGEGGQACAVCSTGNTCWNGACEPECTSGTCAGGCCASAVDCILFADQDDETCGTDGAQCVECDLGTFCSSGICEVL